MILIVGFLTFSKPAFEYHLTPGETLIELSRVENLIAPDAMINLLEISDSSYLLIDLRNPYDYIKGYLGEAINIPVSDILADESISLFEELKENNILVILYGKDQMEANGPWMLLTQLGYDNMKILLGGYNYISLLKEDSANASEKIEYQIEMPIANFAEVLNYTSSKVDKNSKNNYNSKQITPVKRKKKTTAAGGC